MVEWGNSMNRWGDFEIFENLSDVFYVICTRWTRDEGEGETLLGNTTREGLGG
jgi:hypothetical protein